MICKVVAKKCGCCGHHEIGVEREDGTYLALQPGMKVILYSVKEEEPEDFDYHTPT